MCFFFRCLLSLTGRDKQAIASPVLWLALTEQSAEKTGDLHERAAIQITHESGKLSSMHVVGRTFCTITIPLILPGGVRDVISFV